MTQQLAALDIYTIVFELQDLIGSYIDKIYQLTKEEIVIRINNRNLKQKENIYAHSDGLFFRSTRSFETPMKPTTFAMTLRKYLNNGRITEIKQHHFDRIIKITIQKKEQYTLLFELIPNGNIILIGQDEKIIMPLKHQHWSQRSIRIHSTYQPPSNQENPFKVTLDEIKTKLKDSDADLVRTLAVKLSLGGKYAEEICSLLDFSKNMPATQLTDEQIDKVFLKLKEFLAKFKKQQFFPQIVDLEERKEVIPFPLNIYNNFPSKSVSSFSEGIQIIWNPSQSEKKQSPLDTKKEKFIRQKQQQEKAISEFDVKIKQKKHHGDIIYLHYTTIEKLVSEIEENRKLFSKNELKNELNNHRLIKEFSPDSPIVTIQLNDEHNQSVDIQIDYRLSVAENAERLYDKSKKLLEKKQGAIKALERTKQKIKIINQKVEKQIDLQKKNNIDRISEKQFWFEQYRWSISSNGNLILGGKDAKSNDQLIKKHLENKDRYVHADIHGAPSCIIKNKNIDDNIISITDESLDEACAFSACYSKAWKQFAEAQSYWVLPEQVSKSPQSGEFVPKGAFIIRGKRNYCTCKMQLGIGTIHIQDAKKIMGGPIPAIKKWCDEYVIIEPGTKKSSTIAKELATFFDTNPTIIQQVLPPGESKIITKIKKESEEKRVRNEDNS